MRKKLIILIMIILIFIILCLNYKVNAFDQIISSFSQIYVTGKWQNNKFTLYIEDASGIDEKNIKIYKCTNNSKKLLDKTNFESIEVVKQENNNKIKYKYVLSNDILEVNKATKFYMNIVKENQQETKLYFLANKTTHTSNLPPSITNLELKDNSKVQFQLKDGGIIQNCTLYDLNNNEKTILTKNKIKSNTILSFDLSKIVGIKNGQSTQYKIKCNAVDTSGIKRTMVFILETKLNDVIPAIEGFSAKSRDDSSIVLKWKKNNYATGYKLYMNENEKNTNYTLIAETKNNNALTFTQTNLKPKTTYNFKIIAYKDKSTSKSTIIKVTTQAKGLRLDSNSTGCQIAKGKTIMISNFIKLKYSKSSQDGNSAQLIYDSDGYVKGIKGIDFGTTRINLCSKKGDKKFIKVIVVPQNSRINFEKQNYKQIKGNITCPMLYGGNYQNFAITHAGTSNQTIYVSTQTNEVASLYNLANNSVMNFSNYTSHAQGFDMDNNGRIILRAKNKGDSTERNIIYNSFKNNNAGKANKDFILGGEPTIDYENNMIAILRGGWAFVYKYNEYLKGNNVELYSFKYTPNPSNASSNGSVIHNGYLYQLRGSYGGTMYIEAWNFLGGNSIITSEISPNNKGFYSNREAEGIKIYNNHIYIGNTTTDTQTYFYYNIGRLE